MCRDRRQHAVREPLTGLTASPMMNGRGRATGRFGLADVRRRCSISFRRSGAVMGIYDREYYRGETRGSAWFSGVSPVCKSHHRDQRRRLSLREAHPTRPRAHRHAISRRRRKTSPPLPALGIADGDVLPRRHLAPCSEYVVLLDRRPRDGVPVRQPRFSGFLPGAAIFSTLVWVLHGDAVATQTTPSHDRRLGGRHGRGDALHAVLPQARDPASSSSRCRCGCCWRSIWSFPLFPILNGGTTDVAVESHLAGAGFGFLFKQFDLRWSRLFSGRDLPAAAAHLLAGSSRADPVAVAEPVADHGERGQRPASPLRSPCSPKSSSTRGSTRCSPRSPAKAARA